MPRAYVHDPDAVLDYTIDWAGVIGDDPLSTSAWAVTAGDVTIDSDTLSGSLTQVWVSGGTPGVTAELTNHIVTVDGREDDRTITLVIKER